MKFLTASSKQGSLCSVIELYYLIEASEDGQLASPTRIVPDGSLDIVINFEDEFSISDLEFNSKSFSSGSVVGSKTRSVFTSRISSSYRVFGVRLRPSGLFALTNIPQSALCDSFFSIEEIFGASILALRDRLGSCSSFDDMVCLSDQHFLRRLGKHNSVHRLIEPMVSRIESCRGDIQISDLALDFDISHRQINRIFLENIGLSPKMFARLCRVQSAISSLESFALWEGNLRYHDQAHFIKDFSAITGTTPGRFLKSRDSITEVF